MSVILQAAIPSSGPPSYSRRQTSHRVSLPPGSPITQRSLSPSSPPGENTVSNLNEQRRRSSSGANRKRRALTLDMSTTAYTFQAQALTKVQDYKGQCVLEVSQGSISVKVAPCLDLTTENRDLGTWPLDCIRRFNTQVGGVFVFTSGRRGPGGVRDYQFKMSDEDLVNIQQILNQRTGAVFDAPNRSSRASSTSSSSSVPSSTRTESVSSIDDRPPIPTPTSTDPPSSSPHTRRSREYTPTPPPPSPGGRSASPRTGAATIHRMPTSPSPVSPGIGRTHSSSSLLQDYKSPSPLLQGTGPGFKDDHTNPTYQHQFPLHPVSGSESASDKQFHTLPPVLASRQQHHHYEEAKDVVAPKKNRKEKGKKSKKLPQVAEKASEGYDKLVDVRPQLSSVPEERDRSRSEEFNSPSPSAVPVLQRATTDPLAHVELRHKPQSPPPVVDPDTSSLDNGLRNWTKTEIKQVKKLQRETLINSSPVTHERRGAQYTEITLPNDTGSNPRDSTSSESSSLYAVPSSIPATTEFTDGSSTYDIPSSANPSGLAVPNGILAHTPSPTNSRSPSPSNISAPTDLTYDVPRSSPSLKKKTPPHKPLPHLPDDYVNVTLQRTTTQLPTDDQEYINMNGKEEQVDDVYSEIPAHLSKPSLPSEPRPPVRPPVDVAQQCVDSDLYSKISEISPGQFEEQLARKSETLARELASSGYEYVKPAKTPPVMSPKRTTPPASDPLTDEYIVMQGRVIASPTPVTPPATTTVDDDNEYIIVNKSKPKQAAGVAVPGESYVNTPPRTRRGNDGYDEVDGSTILANQTLLARPSSSPKSHDYENASVILAHKEGSSSSMATEPTDEYVNIPESKQRRVRDGYEEVNPAALRYSPPKSNAQATSSGLTPPNGVQRLHTADDASSLAPTKQLDKQASADIGDMIEADVLEESFVHTNGDEDEYMVMRPQRQLSSSSTEDASSSPPTRTNGHKPIPIKVSAENRKRSLTVGNTPDSIPKKHTYENIKEQIFIPQSPPLIDSALSKKPMPLPRPTGYCKKSSSNSEEPIVRKMVRAFSKPVFSPSTDNGAVRRTNSQ